MKTLCREVLWMIANNAGKFVKGPGYTQEQCDALPGRYMQNPGAQTRWHQPVFEDQMEAWENQQEMRAK
jgi:hypothetical protein